VEWELGIVAPYTEVAGGSLDRDDVEIVSGRGGAIIVHANVQAVAVAIVSDESSTEIGRARALDETDPT